MYAKSSTWPVKRVKQLPAMTLSQKDRAVRSAKSSVQTLPSYAANLSQYRKTFPRVRFIQVGAFLQFCNPKNIILNPRRIWSQIMIEKTVNCSAQFSNEHMQSGIYNIHHVDSKSVLFFKQSNIYLKNKMSLTIDQGTIDEPNIIPIRSLGRKKYKIFKYILRKQALFTRKYLQNFHFCRHYK